eukprot:g5824.t1
MWASKARASVRKAGGIDVLVALLGAEIHGVSAGANGSDTGKEVNSTEAALLAATLARCGGAVAAALRVLCGGGGGAADAGGVTHAFRALRPTDPDAFFVGDTLAAAVAAAAEGVGVASAEDERLRSAEHGAAVISLVVLAPHASAGAVCGADQTGAKVAANLELQGLKALPGDSESCVGAGVESETMETAPSVDADADAKGDVGAEDQDEEKSTRQAGGDDASGGAASGGEASADTGIQGSGGTNAKSCDDVKAEPEAGAETVEEVDEAGVVGGKAEGVKKTANEATDAVGSIDNHASADTGAGANADVAAVAAAASAANRGQLHRAGSMRRLVRLLDAWPSLLQAREHDAEAVLDAQVAAIVTGAEMSTEEGPSAPFSFELEDAAEEHLAALCAIVWATHRSARARRALLRTGGVTTLARTLRCATMEHTIGGTPSLLSASSAPVVAHVAAAARAAAARTFRNLSGGEDVGDSSNCTPAGVSGADANEHESHHDHDYELDEGDASGVMQCKTVLLDNDAVHLLA